MNIAHLPLAAIFVLICVTLCVSPARAQETTASESQNSSDQTTLTGDWHGARTRLKNAGINLRANYKTESAANPSGGQSQAARYTQEIDFGVDVNLGRLAAIPDAMIQITLTDRAGHSLSADAIGSQFDVQTLYGAGQNFRLSEMNYRQQFLGGRITVGLGWAPVGDDFAQPMALCAFQNDVFCGHANAMTTNSGAHNFPTAEWGAHVKMRLKPSFYAATGIYQVNPDQNKSDKGFDLSFHGSGVFIPIELGWLRGEDGKGLPGYYDSSATPDVLTDIHGLSAGLTGSPFAERNGRWGTYLSVGQTVSRPRPQSMRGLRIGGLVGMGDRETARFRYFFDGGWVHQGPFSHRDNDFISMAIAYVRTNPRLTQYQEDRNRVAPGSAGVQRYESVVELDYSVRLAPWFSVRPNLQYVINPGGTGKIANAFVVGLHTEVTF